MHFAIKDLGASLIRWRLWMLLGWLEIRQRYARSRIGPFWLTISTSVMITSIGLVYGTLFGQKMGEYLPFLAVSIIFWTMFSQIVTEGSLAYISSATYIRQISTPKTVFILQVVWRNIIIFGHNLLIIVVLLIVFGVKSYTTLPLFLPGFVLFLLNAAWIAMVVALVSARFRDLPQIIAAMIQVAFYVTPIIYKPGSLTRFRWVVDYNPLTYMMSLVRDPLTGVFPSDITWAVGIALAIVGWSFALFVTGRYAKRIPYWV
ncbi:ABC transporter permease [Paraburkholderia phytofirmans]|uniref:ABC-2 type transporter n=1 Tax=Paraburkholderia phytofirmans (strain DSM 17436 / LMG 22146 / PsJN) TaxID=398527 RepID=B2T9A2_PARPJ|nr:ABC transporter permease [Paraburkholderia phytofirmans]ACD21004.1 ABC-2 type transporter [Paraburkholderia phytofirmans PsJN]